ncbi:MAG TPA: HepT-like ribonuclease domain-containing protein [Blastocatellia bacterium]|jgi:uncharacterized protein with HEPN domain|nr:HepT-like ribonuclease domain-containing protein [Blastocatellia bacterium]
MKDDLAYLAHISECIRRIQEDVNGGRDEFFASHTIQDAVIRNLQTLSESTKRLSSEIKAANPEIEWSSIAGLRNVLVHAYFDVDLDVIWESCSMTCQS